MPRLIDADALVATLKQKYCADCPALFGCDCSFDDDLRDINNAPTIDAVPVWVSVKDRMPEENVPVLVWELQGFAYVDVYKDGAWEVGTPNLAKFTHWMPLPEPPKEVSEC